MTDERRKALEAAQYYLTCNPDWGDQAAIKFARALIEAEGELAAADKLAVLNADRATNEAMWADSLEARLAERQQANDRLKAEGRLLRESVANLRAALHAIAVLPLDRLASASGIASAALASYAGDQLPKNSPKKEGQS